MCVVRSSLVFDHSVFDHSNTSTQVFPKTIDGDLKHELIPISFGFDTATKVYSELIGNVGTDALSSRKKFHFVRLMGRSASHVTLECALKCRPNLVFIGEEIRANKWTLSDITTQLVDMIEARMKQGTPFGLVLRRRYDRIHR